ncbi:MAG: exodeoxyribonuclease VII large subunit [Ruminococcaceae bacterium]|nr:exodeoxyribonuclease VII large subunit [Oscillospiraceae bacterium]
MYGADPNRENAFSVSQVNEYIKMLLESNPTLKNIWVVGEISGAKLYASGHLYFSVKDENSVLSAVMFRSSLMNMDFRPEDGMRVLIHGRLSAYPPRGQYQLIADRMIPDGAGAMALAFEQLKNKLAAEGLFDPARKRPMPPHPRRIGVVTSPSGAAIHDIIRVAGGRDPSVEIILYPSLVQGDRAAASLVAGVRYFNQMKDHPELGVDLMIVGRGGGSAEDLWVFNHEALAREIAASQLPVVSAVGHEVDFSISDFVADLRAATPSAAAELIIPDSADARRYIDNLYARLKKPVEEGLRRRHATLDLLAGAGVLISPEAMYIHRKEAIKGLGDRIDQTVLHLHAQSRQTLTRLTAQLEALSPLAVLSRGYTLTQDGQGRVMTSAASLSEGDDLTVRFVDGAAAVSVKAVTLFESENNT